MGWGWWWYCGSVIEHLPTMHEALAIPCTEKEKKKKMKKKVVGLNSSHVKTHINPHYHHTTLLSPWKEVQCT
jgi:hypothetical protein